MWMLKITLKRRILGVHFWKHTLWKDQQRRISAWRQVDIMMDQEEEIVNIQEDITMDIMMDITMDREEGLVDTMMDREGEVVDTMMDRGEVVVDTMMDQEKEETMMDTLIDQEQKKVIMIELNQLLPFLNQVLLPLNPPLNLPLCLIYNAPATLLDSELKVQEGPINCFGWSYLFIENLILIMCLCVVFQL
jgi:hypothetical protein